MTKKQIMNTNTTMKNTRMITVLCVGLMGAALPVVLTGCAGRAVAPQKSGFLSYYKHMKQVDDTTWRSVTPGRLAMYQKFHITAAQCRVEEYDGKPLTPEAQQKVADYLRESVTRALSDRYPIVNTYGPDVGDIRLAITQAYKTGNQLGLTVEGEIVDSISGYQGAAVMRTELGKPYLGDWWDGPSAKEIIDAWSLRLRQTIDSMQASQ
jgi:hypothetical protein